MRISTMNLYVRLVYVLFLSGSLDLNGLVIFFCLCVKDGLCLDSVRTYADLVWKRPEKAEKMDSVSIWGCVFELESI